MKKDKWYQYSTYLIATVFLGIVIYGVFLLPVKVPIGQAGEFTTPDQASLPPTSPSVSPENLSPVPEPPQESLAQSPEIAEVEQLTKELVKKKEIVVPSIQQKGYRTLQKAVPAATLLKIAETRKTKMLTLAEKAPAAFLFYAIKAEMKNTFSSDVQQEIESETTQKATLNVIHIDDFEHRKAEYKYFLDENGRETSLYPVGEMPVKTSGTEVQVKGYRLANKMVAAVSPETFTVVKAAPLPDTIGDQKTLVLLIDFKDSPSQRPFTKEQIAESTFGRTQDLQKFYKETSYDQVSFSGDVIDWFRLPKDSSSSYYECTTVRDSDIQSVILANKIDLSKYDRLIIFAPSGCNRGAGTIGKRDFYVGGLTYRISITWSSFNLNTISHELGHNLGALHANAWDCQSGGPLYGDCRKIEYGNYYDIMGRGGINTAMHFNAVYIDLFKWLDSASTITISQSGRYTLSPLESKKGVRIARIQPPGYSSAPYYLEFRQGLGYDSGLNDPSHELNKKGLFINLQKGFDQDAILLKMTPPYCYYCSSSTKSIFTLNEGSFSDIKKGITIGPIAQVDANSITFDVTVHPVSCIQDKPRILSSETFSLTAGGLGAFIEVSNEDTVLCTPSLFQLTIHPPIGWKANVYQSVQINPQQSNFISFEIVPPDTKPGYYDGEFIVTNTNSKLSTTKKIIFEVLPKTCTLDSDCSAGQRCVKDKCVTEVSCTDSIKNGDETDIDCGGICLPCILEKECIKDKDCQSNKCDPQKKKCVQCIVENDCHLEDICTDNICVPRGISDLRLNPLSPDLVVSVNGTFINVHAPIERLLDNNTVIVVSPNKFGKFRMGDEVLLLDTDKGKYEFNQIKSINPSNETIFTFNTAVTLTTQNRSLQIVSVPHFTTVLIKKGAALTVEPYFFGLGGSGGVIAFRSRDKVIIDGMIDVKGRGYLGGGSFEGFDDGLSGDGPGAGSGGKKGNNLSLGGAGGGGAGHAFVGKAGICDHSKCACNDVFGDAGLAYGNENKLFLGSGGGSGYGDISINRTGGGGGSGGGIIFIATKQLTNNGLLTANGDDGEIGLSGGGGGSGGTVQLIIPNYIGPLPSVEGGKGSMACGLGGTASAGRVKIIECFADTDCDVGKKCYAQTNQTNKCVQCLTDGHCPPGNSCKNNQCVPLSECAGKANGTSCMTTGGTKGFCTAQKCIGCSAFCTGYSATACPINKCKVGRVCIPSYCNPKSHICTKDCGPKSYSSCSC